MMPKKKNNSDLAAIGMAAQKAGVSRQSLQYYLMLGLLDPTEITAAGRRLFDAAAIDRIRLIKTLNANGYTLRGIRELFLQQDRRAMKGKE